MTQTASSLDIFALRETFNRERIKPADVVPGVIAFWDRSTPGRPDTSWHGHVGPVCEHAIGAAFGTIEANSGPTGQEVARMVRRLDDPKFLGIGLND